MRCKFRPLNALNPVIPASRQCNCVTHLLNKVDPAWRFIRTHTGVALQELQRSLRANDFTAISQRLQDADWQYLAAESSQGTESLLNAVITKCAEYGTAESLRCASEVLQALRRCSTTQALQIERKLIQELSRSRNVARQRLNEPLIACAISSALNAMHGHEGVKSSGSNVKSNGTDSNIVARAAADLMSEIVLYRLDTGHIGAAIALLPSFTNCHRDYDGNILESVGHVPLYIARKMLEAALNFDKPLCAQQQEQNVSFLQKNGPIDELSNNFASSSPSSSLSKLSKLEHISGGIESFKYTQRTISILQASSETAEIAEEYELALIGSIGSITDAVTLLNKSIADLTESTQPKSVALKVSKRLKDAFQIAPSQDERKILPHSTSRRSQSVSHSAKLIFGLLEKLAELISAEQDAVGTKTARALSAYIARLEQTLVGKTSLPAAKILLSCILVQLSLGNVIAAEASIEDLKRTRSARDSEYFSQSLSQSDDKSCSKDAQPYAEISSLLDAEATIKILDKLPVSSSAYEHFRGRTVRSALSASKILIQNLHESSADKNHSLFRVIAAWKRAGARSELVQAAESLLRTSEIGKCNGQYTSVRSRKENDESVTIQEQIELAVKALIELGDGTAALQILEQIAPDYEQLVLSILNGSLPSGLWTREQMTEAMKLACKYVLKQNAQDPSSTLLQVIRNIVMSGPCRKMDTKTLSSEKQLASMCRELIQLAGLGDAVKNGDSNVLQSILAQFKR